MLHVELHLHRESAHTLFDHHDSMTCCLMTYCSQRGPTKHGQKEELWLLVGGMLSLLIFNFAIGNEISAVLAFSSFFL